MRPAFSSRPSHTARCARALLSFAGAVLAALVIAPQAFAAPSNDDIASPFNVDAAIGIPVTLGSAVDATATIETGEPLTAGNGVCNPGGRTVVSTTWYRVLGNGGTLSIDTDGSDFDTLIAAYLAPVPGIDDGLPCNDDASASVVTSAISFATVAGRAYLIQVGGCDCGGTTTGNLVMHVSQTEPPPQPMPTPLPAPPAPPAPPPVLITPPDRDGDGIPDARDKCPDLKPTTDANNDGCPDSPRHIRSKLGFSLQGASMIVVELTSVPTGARVSVTCSSCRRKSHGRTQRFRNYSFTAKKGGTQLLRGLNGLQLALGKRVTVIVTSPGAFGRKITVVGARGRTRNKRTNTCLAVGSTTRRVPCS